LLWYTTFVREINANIKLLYTSCVTVWKPSWRQYIKRFTLYTHFLHVRYNNYAREE